MLLAAALLQLMLGAGGAAADNVPGYRAAKAASTPLPEVLYPRQDMHLRPGDLVSDHTSFEADWRAGGALPSLRALAKPHGVWMGSASNYGALKAGGQYASVLAAQYDLVTAENACKWSPTEPQRDQYDLTQCQYILANAKANGAVMRGHNLCWGNYNPAWLTNGHFDAETLQQLLNEHISKVGGAFANDASVVCWDVVNEALNNTGVKPSDPWGDDLPGFVEMAFKQASKTFGAKQELFYNDFGAEGSGAKSDEVFDYVKGMLADGVQVNGVGLQMHVDIDAFPAYADVSANMARLAALGLDIHITEMDVGCKGCDAAGLKKQAAVYGGMLTACLNEPRCKSFETWGFSDAHTWRAGSSPLPFDKDYQPKPAFWELVSVLNATVPVPRAP